MSEKRLCDRCGRSEATYTITRVCDNWQWHVCTGCRQVAPKEIRKGEILRWAYNKKDSGAPPTNV